MIACRHQFAGSSGCPETHATRRRDAAQSARGTIRRCLVPVLRRFSKRKRSLKRQSIFYTKKIFQTCTLICHEAVLPRRERAKLRGTMKKRDVSPAATVSRNVAPTWRKMKTSSFDVIITCSPRDKIVNYIFTTSDTRRSSRRYFCARAKVFIKLSRVP